MKGYFCIGVFLFVNSLLIEAQVTDTLRSKAWELSADLNLYMIPQDAFLLPVFRADKNALHLEGRYNYEDYQTFSAWAGYNISGGKKFEYAFTPMIGGVVGNTKGISVGLEMTLNYKKFELYSEIEFMKDAEAHANDYLYNWSDLTYSPNEWLWFGISGQRTRLVQTPLDVQRGILVGAGLKNWEITAYVFNLGFPEPYGLVTLTFNY